MTSLKQGLKNTFRKFFAGAYYLSGAYKNSHMGKVIILMYHRVLSDKELNKYFIQPGMYVHKDVFEKQMEFLKKNYCILNFAELLNLWREGKLSKDKRYCVVTFDDGWLDNYLYAYPILQKYEIPATIFLPTAFIGTKNWFWADRLGYLLWHCKTDRIVNQKIGAINTLIAGALDRHNTDTLAVCNEINTIIEALKSLPEADRLKLFDEVSAILDIHLPDERVLLNWDEIQVMSQTSISFGTHSLTHRMLTQLSSDDIQKELKESLDMLQNQRVNFVPVFCYPNGSNSREIVDQVKSAGYQAAVTTVYGHERTSSNPADLYTIKRIGVHQDISYTIPLFSFHISGFFKKWGHVSQVQHNRMN